MLIALAAPELGDKSRRATMSILSEELCTVDRYSLGLGGVAAASGGRADEKLHSSSSFVVDRMGVEGGGE